MTGYVIRRVGQAVAVVVGVMILTFIGLISMLSWLSVARLVRGEVLSLRPRDFVLAARMMSSTRNRLLWRHLLPNAIGVIVVNATFTIADAILYLSTLSFLGLGLSPPQADWGTMLSKQLKGTTEGAIGVGPTSASYVLLEAYGVDPKSVHQASL